MVKNYLLDTNILLENPDNIYGFEDNNVWITGTTTQELDAKKSAPGDVGYNARESIRILDKLRTQGDLVKGVELPNGGHLMIEPDGVNKQNLPDGFDISVPDNRIISSCIFLNKNRCRDSHIILLTNDVSMRLNATICGVEVQAVKNDRVEDTEYTGRRTVETSPDVINALYKEKFLDKDYLDDGGSPIKKNEFLTLRCGSQSALAVYHHGKIELIDDSQLHLFGGVRPKNEQQKFFVWAITRGCEDIPLVVVKAPAGCGKTYLSLAAGLQQTRFDQEESGRYRKILLAKPNTETSDPSYGYLPGELDEKMAPVLAPYYDNLESLFTSRENETNSQVRMQIDGLFASGTLEACALSYIRGRSIIGSFLIADEVQNANRTLIRDIITRTAKGSTTILSGDITQIDNPRLDKFTSGLSYAYDRWADSDLAAVLTMDETASVRSPLAKEALVRMK